MKAISLWEPWASAVAIGSKRIETRSWTTRYRGPLAIHAGKRFVLGEMENVFDDLAFAGALYPITRVLKHSDKFQDPKQVKPHLTFGAVVAVCDLQAIYRSEDLARQGDIYRLRFPPFGNEDLRTEAAWCEDDLGNYRPGRFGWMLANVRALATPIPYKGEQGLFDVPDWMLRNAEILDSVDGWLPSDGLVPTVEEELSADESIRRRAIRDACYDIGRALIGGGPERG